jgi:glycine hydroxymethyltransferase
VAFAEALTPEFQTYQQQVVKNAQAMADTLMGRGFKVVSGGTDNHLMLVDLIERPVTGKAAEEALGQAHITVNKNAVPNDPRSPFVTSGIRLGTPAITTRGFGERETRLLAGWVCDILERPEDAALRERVRREVLGLCARFPVYSDEVSL